jgi:hypothetical protein
MLQKSEVVFQKKYTAFLLLEKKEKTLIRLNESSDPDTEGKRRTGEWH